MISEPLKSGNGPVFLGTSGRLHGLQILACIAMALTCQLCCTASKARPDWFYEISLPADGMFYLKLQHSAVIIEGMT